MSHYNVSQSTTLLNALVEGLGIKSPTRARKLIKLRMIMVNDQLAVRADQMLEPKDRVRLLRKEEIQRFSAPFEILLEDADVLLAVKPSGILSVDRDNERGERTFLKIVNDYVKESSNNKSRAFLVHRLDKEVSGVMIFAKSIEIRERLQEGWQDTEKFYQAIVEGVPPKDAGRIESFLTENKALRVYSTTKESLGKLAITHYRIIKRIDAEHTLVEVRLETGRKNQIRVHLSDIGCPIIGDKKYGAKSNPVKRIALHAFHFAFNHPVTGERVVVESLLPRKLKDLLH